MTAKTFGYERVEMDRFLVGWGDRPYEAIRVHEGLHRDARDHWFGAASGLGSAQVIPFSIGGGEENCSLQGRARLPDIARDLAVKFAAIQGLFVTTQGIGV